MGKFKKYIMSVLIIALCLEAGLLIGEGYRYCKSKSARVTVNGKIICRLDQVFNFSKIASR